MTIEQQKVLHEFLYPEETYVIRGAIFEVYKEMGSGFLETVYQECLAKEFKMRNIPFEEKPLLSLQYNGQPLGQTYVPDFICHEKIIIEIKGIKKLCDVHRAQLLNYMKATHLKLGLLVNFGHFPQVQIERMIRSCQ